MRICVSYIRVLLSLSVTCAINRSLPRAGCSTCMKPAPMLSGYVTSDADPLAPMIYCNTLLMYELEREEHIVTHSQLEEALTP